MKKKIIITLGILTVLFTSIAGFAVASGVMDKKDKPSDYKIGVTYEEALSNPEKPILAVFYVDWCGYCLRFMPKYKILNTLYKDKYNFVMINAEDPAYKKLVEDVSLTGFPTVFILDPKYDNRVHLSQSIYADLGKFRTEIDRYVRIRRILDKAEAIEK